MSESTPRAVFLSYASQDGEAVRRLAEALRAAGVEVWFDLDELRGGDEWDRKIRQQIRACALFVPVISANTQARPEGYFRLEWHLAEQRSLLIAKGRAFLVPVCLDATTEAEALVPDAFLGVQWSRLGPAYGAPGRPEDQEKLKQFVAQVQRLLAQPQAGSSSRRSGSTGKKRPSDDSESPVIADYELLRQIGQGSYGDVWLARTATGLWRAVKVVWRERFADAEPFEREWRGLKEFAAVSLGESSQMALLHVGRNDEAGFFYYVMELADDAERGRAIDPANYVPLTMAEVRRGRGRLPAAEVVRLGVDLARTLSALHGRGLVHRDIKPSNVILVNGTPKLADIGLVSLATDARTFVGTEGFVPPEGPGAPGADVYALGKVLYELATGLDRQEFPQLPEDFGQGRERRLPLALNEVILRACEPKAAQRYQDATALLADLEALQAGRSVRRFPRWPLAAAAMVAVGVVGFFLTRNLSEPSAQPMVSAAKAPIAAPPAENVIAVLPFSNLGGDATQAYLADGLTEAIIDALARERGLRVIGRTSSFALRDQNITAKEVGRMLEVGSIVEGSVLREGGRVRIRVGLTRVSDGTRESIGLFEREGAELFALQDEVTRAVVQKLAPRTLEGSPRPPTVTGATMVVPAYEAYLRGRALQTGGLTGQAGTEMIAAFEEAVMHDPNYALAWARLSQGYLRLLMGGRGGTDGFGAKLREAAATAFRLVPDLPEAHLATALIKLNLEGDLEATQRELDEIVRLRPNDAEAHALRVRVEHARGNWGAELPRMIQVAVERDPRNADTLSNLAGILSSTGRFAEADRLYERSRAIADIGILRRPLAANWVKWTGDAAGAGRMLDGTPAGTFDPVLLPRDRARMRALEGETAGAIADYEKLRALAAGADRVPLRAQLDYVPSLARLERRRGNVARAHELYSELLQAAQVLAKDSPGGAGFNWTIAQARAGRGETAEARLALAEALRERPRNTFASSVPARRMLHAEVLALLGDVDDAVAELRAVHDMGWAFGYLLRLEPQWDSLRHHPGFQALMKESEAHANAQPRPTGGLAAITPPTTQ